MALPAVKQKMKVAPERRAMTKIWNVSDWPDVEAPAQILVVMGTAVPPGGVIEVPNDQLKNAHKTHRDVELGLLHVGAEPPAEYKSWKGTGAKAKLPKDMTRSHGANVAVAQEAMADNLQRGQTSLAAAGGSFKIGDSSVTQVGVDPSGVAFMRARSGQLSAPAVQDSPKVEEESKKSKGRKF